MLESLPLSNLLILDVETVPLFEKREQMPEKLKSLWAKKSDYLNKDEIPEDEFYQRAGIYAEFGKIVCISVGIFANPEGTEFRVKSFSGDDEKEILTSFSKLLNAQGHRVLCAHNGKEFDFPYLARRIVINGLKMPKMLEIAGKKPWEIPFLDTLELWKFGDYKSYTSLELLTTILNIPSPKDDIQGSDVYRVYYEEKGIDRITKYCEKDVLAVAQLLLRFRNQPLLSAENISGMSMDVIA
ncbi:MAG: DNA polymerase elongation subunit (family B) [Sphingobacteriales bacterium]|jgi:DNA polymerase elongation subunit (family B)